MLRTISLFNILWAEAINTAMYIPNYSSNTQVGDKTPYELWHGIKSFVHHYQIFDTIAYVFIDKFKHSKFDFKAQQMVFVDYSFTSTTWHF